MLVFTICSNNYLAQAYTLAESVRIVNPEIHFVVGLVDLINPKIDYQKYPSVEVIPCFDLGYPEFEGMLARYNVIEFNTAVKPYYFDFFFNREPNLDRIYYVDPDIFFYRGFEQLEIILDKNNIVLTPMITDPGQTSQFDELVSLRHGMFNLGFIGIKRSAESQRFLDWWMTRLRDYCLIDKPRGIFVDQKWIDLAPLFFEGIHVLKHKGYNMAWWNFNDRKLVEVDGDYYVNSESYPLIFFHFSGFKPGSSSITGRSANNRFSYDSLPELRVLGQKYAAELLKNDYDFLSAIEPSLVFYTPKVTFKINLKRNLKRVFRFLK
ncbi:hypothetical protein GCM10009119_38520 [Algoriphagus jejuensis]|uniref:Nucleotide-diphospho-sugar transferase n=1 Tax=Algoriphagus jejuensis TaxID=419934 RepID=A0ABN1N4S3_9BACT